MVKSSKDILVDVMSSSEKFKRSVMPRVYKKLLNSYESSEENLIRSIAVYYSVGIVGKKKYRKIYKDSCYRLKGKGGKSVRLSIINNCPLPRLVPYNRLMPYIKSIPLGTIYSTYDTLCDVLDDDDKVRGCYRRLNEMLVKLAEFYLSGTFGREEKNKWKPWKYSERLKVVKSVEQLKQKLSKQFFLMPLRDPKLQALLLERVAGKNLNLF